MDLFEHQAKELFADYGIPVPRGIVAAHRRGGTRGGRELTGRVVVKAQVKTGGRGKAGGVKVADDPPTPSTKARQILGMDIKGHTVHKVLVEEASDDRGGVLLLLPARPREPHLPRHLLAPPAAWTSRRSRRPTPEKVAKVPVDRADRRRPRQGRARSRSPAGCPSEALDGAAELIEKLWAVFVDEDATLVEVNPMILYGRRRRSMALDGKVTLDDNAVFRQPDHEAYADKAAEDPLEARPRRRTSTTSSSTARSASSATARPGHVHARRGRLRRRGIPRQPTPANFLDIGGGASAEVMADGLEIILSDPA